VLTNCDNDLFEQTHRRFSKPFDLVVTAERVRDYKPSLTHFRSFAELSGADQADWIHVACSFYHDIEPAGRFGVRTVWLDRDNTGEDPAAASAHVTSASEVTAAIRRLRQ
jgi:2-haloacid dehalogenase